MNIKYLTKYDVFLATVKRWRSVDEISWENFKLETNEEVLEDILEAIRDNKETEKIMDERFEL